jgi:hypothetical protein
LPFWVSEDDRDELARVEFANVERIIDKVSLPADPVSQIIRHLLAHLAEIKLGADEKHVIGALDLSSIQLGQGIFSSSTLRFWSMKTVRPSRIKDAASPRTSWLCSGFAGSWL